MEERDHLKMPSEDTESPWSWIPLMKDPGWIRNVWTCNLNAQTMNYVGQLAGQVFVTVKELYKGLNPATLSGCIDVIVVRQPDGNLHCSPFHVRFGKMGVLRSKEKVVDIEINGESVDLHMKLGDNGEAFFVEETGDDQEAIPYHLATSPILTEGTALMELQLKRNSVDRIRNMDTGSSSQLPTSVSSSAVEPTSSSCSVKKRRKRRRRSAHKIDTSKRDENDDTTEDENMFPIEISSDEENELLDNTRTSASDLCRDEVLEINTTSISVLPHHHSDGEWSPSPSPSGSRPPTPKSDSELVNKSLERGVQKNNPQMHWDWGELPQATKSVIPLRLKESSSAVNVNPSESTHFRVIQNDILDDLQSSTPLPVVEQADAVLTLEEPELQEGIPEINEPNVEMLGAAAPPLPANEDVKQAMACLAQPTSSKTDSPSRKKDKRSRHLGADGVYLDDITDMEPEVAALYFPKNDEHAAQSKVVSENVPRSANQSPQTVGSSGIDSGIESTSDGIRDLPSIAISLCGGLSENKEISKEKFLEQEVSYQQFVDNPAIIDDPNLVVKIGSKYYNWTTAAPLLLAMQAFQKPLPKATVDSIMRDKMPKKGGRWWFSWRGRTSSIKEETKPMPGLSGKEESNIQDRIKDESSSSDEDPRASSQPFASSANPGHLPLLSGVGFKKTLRLSSEQLKSLNLKNGPNDVIFSVTTQYQGTCRCEGTIYLWNWDDKVIISDIDGTITRSDTLGHILPTLGKDWTHQGIAKLYHKVSQNGYKFLYCSARAIGMADMTRGYLHWVNERGTVLPQGPVLLSPSSLFSAFHREVIEKKPEKFKVQCLTDIKNLFHPNTEPFYAAFGNRPADVYSYKQVGVSLNRIFTVNPKGELIQEHAKTNISSYVRLCEVVDHVFPLLKRSHSSDFPCSDTYSQFTYWRDPLPPFENQEMHPHVP
ncbi:phosphatidate phosphatase LPIN1 isoform X2 [Podarcis raffonei]|uniref:phosphatidate phosphatase LPIN1 isoform X2 n=1 Tax=Podarcis raffonei TaxID=65483 RepID=UPI0023293606|nr:phosphatidate phosphatase LPIN1 isoform X2 [Podarcis raffonei]